MKISGHKATIVYITTFPPRECGIATFTSDLIDNFDKLYAKQEETKVIAVTTDSSHHIDYPEKVIAKIRQDNKEDYLNAANMLNDMKEVELVAVEHEYGIYGDNYGSNILYFLENINKPVTVTFHTVLPDPSVEMKDVTQKIIEYSDKVIVMTDSSKKILEEVYGAPQEKVRMIPHGIHPIPFSDGEDAKEQLDLTDKKVLSTFGFLSRGKGIEFGIKAISKVVKDFPDIMYLIVGETHPVVKQREGESYRKELQDLVKKLKLEKHIKFYDQYLQVADLLKFLEATDIYLSLSQNPFQAVSGTFSYALGAGRPVISTEFAQAKEVITSEVGALVEIGSEEGVAREIRRLLNDKGLIISMSKNAYFRTRIMTWPNVALSYMREFASIAPELAMKEKVVPPLKIAHLMHLTDNFGIFQFAILDKPDPLWGYTLDDNARALVVMAWCANLNKEKKIARKLSRQYLRFISRCASKGKKGFVNYFDSRRIPHNERNSEENLEDANARALWALAEVFASKLNFALRFYAKLLFKKHLNHFKDVKSPRAVAFIIKSCAVYLKKTEDESIRQVLRSYADFLVDLWSDVSNDAWQWFEESLTYANGTLPEAMLIAYEVFMDDKYKNIGKSALDFLILNSFEGSVLVPVGQSGWLKRGGKKHLYDQQPEEVSALVLALSVASRIFKDSDYEEKMENAFNWFLGNNTLNQMVYSQMTGGSYDGIREKEVNLNQGAESTVSYLLARLSMEQ